jgi:acetoin utilization deacetylase AcuC-like enzyme
MVRGALADRIEPVVAQFRPEAIVVAAGFDGHGLDDMSGLAYSTRLYGHLGATMAGWARRFCQGRVVSILEGGYHLAALADSVEAYLMEVAKETASCDKI